MKLVVFSICHNEEKTIGELLDLIPKRINGIDKIETFVLDDGSTDNTALEAKKHGAKVFSNVKPKRLASAFPIAVDRALEMDADIAVNIDGDLQFDPSDIPSLVAPIVEGKADFVVGNRFVDVNTGKRKRPENMPVTKYFGNILGTWVVSLLISKKFDDVTSGYRAYNREALLSININTKDTYTQESFQVLANKKLNIIQIPVHIKYFKDRKSRVVTNVLNYIMKSSLNILRSFRDFAPLKFFTYLSLLSTIPGVACLIFIGIHFLRTETFTPYKFVGFTGLYLVTMGIIVFLFGVMADMVGRIVNNQEKILYYSKKNYFDKKK